MSSRQRKCGGTKGLLGEQVSQLYNEKTDCPVPYISCVCKGIPLPLTVDGDDAGVRMRCTNNRCHLMKIFLHEKCFEQLEETLLKILSNLGSARGWTDAQLRSNLWEKKGQTLISKLVRCHCGQGLMSRDVEFYKKHELELSKDSQQQAEAKQRKKKNQKKKLPSLNFNSNAPVSADLLQNDYVGISRRASYGHTSFSSSALFYGHALSDSETDNVYEWRTTTPTPTPTKSKLFVEKPKPLSADRPNTKPKPAIVHTPKLRQRKETKLLKEVEARSKNCVVAKEKREPPKPEETTPTSKKVPAITKMILQQPEAKKEALSDVGEQRGRNYTLFDSRGFFLGELLLANAHLPWFPHSA